MVFIYRKGVIKMPGGDGTGPRGAGRMTGRGAGYCAGNQVPGYANPVPGRGRGAGYGLGRGRGWGRGRGFRHGWAGYGAGWGYPYEADPYYGNPGAPEFTPEQEAEALKSQAKALEGEIDSINKRIKELGSAAKKAK